MDEETRSKIIKYLTMMLVLEKEIIEMLGAGDEVIADHFEELDD